MKKIVTLRIKPSEASDSSFISRLITAETGTGNNSLSGYNILKRSIDARSRQVYVNLSVEAFIHEPFQVRQKTIIKFPEVFNATKKIIIVGGGPAGLFAALQLIEKGIKPIILERGKDVKSRRRDLAILNKEGIINPESNYCFGEGGAGTYSDGKLYTRSTKRGDVKRILELFVAFGADELILADAHPHIGTNKLPKIITTMRENILRSGGEVHFDTRVTDFELRGDRIRSVIATQKGKTIQFPAEFVLLATGHSARDIFS